MAAVAEALSDVELLLDDLARFEFDPLGFVLWAFPWGEEGSTLAKEDGPEDWQREQLLRIGAALKAGGDLGAIIEEDVSAGHGVGKSAMVSWVILWAVSTHENTRGVVTANTDTQLRTKTWAELAKWHQLFVARELFSLTATAIYSVEPGADKTWRIDQIPWSKERSEAFAGLHNKGNRILVLFDEASAIDDIIWEVTEGALTDEKTQILWLRYGNPTRTAGQFHRRCSMPKRNTFTRVDSREVRFTNKTQIKAWIDEYGEDSDFVRVRVKGQFPRIGQANFIAVETAEEARRRTATITEYGAWPKVLSIDPARFGDDESVFTLRQGTKVHWQRAVSKMDGPDLAGRAIEILAKNPGIVAIVYDAIGIGADLDSSLRRAPGMPELVAVSWGVPAKDSTKYFNLRAECWGRMKDWLATGDIPDDDRLCTQVTCLNYGYDALFRIQLESKKDLKKRLGMSPDRADSLALSFMLEAVELKGERTKAQTRSRPRAAGWT